MPVISTIHCVMDRRVELLQPPTFWLQFLGNGPPSSEAGVYFRFDYFFFALFRVVLRLAASTFDLLRRSAACARL